jgi:protein KRI1
LQDHQRLALLSSDPSLDPNDPDAFVPPSTTIPLTHVQEERALREEVTQAFHAAAADDEDEDEDDGFLQKKDDKAVDEDREAYRKFMLESGGGEEAVREILGLGSSRDEDHVENAVALTVIDEVDDALGGKKKKKKQKTKERTKEKDDEFLMK